jgi:ABC-type proline/glycine betaine transport system permease subunit
MIGAPFSFLGAAFNAFLFLDSADVLGRGQRELLLRTSILALVAAVAAFPAGVGIVQRRRYGLVLFHFLWALNTIGSLGLLGLSWLVLAGALWWLVNTVYFHKRRHEFTLFRFTT